MLRLIKNDLQYEDSLERVYALMQRDLAEGASESDELEVLSTLIKEYENEHYPIAPPHPLEGIEFRLVQMALPESELSELLGARSRKSEILSGKRELSLARIRKLNERLKIPASVLIQEY